MTDETMTEPCENDPRWTEWAQNQMSAMGIALGELEHQRNFEVDRAVRAEIRVRELLEELEAARTAPPPPLSPEQLARVAAVQEAASVLRSTSFLGRGQLSADVVIEVAQWIVDGTQILEPLVEFKLDGEVAS